jgi:hypothetical protein
MSKDGKADYQEKPDAPSFLMVEIMENRMKIFSFDKPTNFS